MSKGADNWYDLPRAADMTKRLTILIIGALLAATDARAQTAGDALRTVLFGGDTTTGALSGNSPALYGLLLGETTTFPIGSSAGGFTWLFDSNLRVPVRRSELRPDVRRASVHDRQGQTECRRHVPAHDVRLGGRPAAVGDRGLRDLRIRRRDLSLDVVDWDRDRSDDRQRDLRCARPGGPRRHRAGGPARVSGSAPTTS